MGYLFSSESVSEGHPDKVADQISDAIIDAYLAQDSEAHTAIETMVTTNRVIICGEVNAKENVNVDIKATARDVIRQIGYTKQAYNFCADSCEIEVFVHQQSGDINRGVARENAAEQGAGDQGMMFGYAIKGTDNYMPLALDVSHQLLKELAAIRKEGKEMTYLRPDAKSQVTLEFGDDNKAKRIHTIVISTQHDEFLTPANGQTQEEVDESMRQRIEDDVRKILIPRVFNKHAVYSKYLDGEYNLLVNPTGKFVIGGPHGDTGLTGRKIIVDTYGGRGAHGGGAFSGKDPSKVDRSAAYATRHIAKNLVAADICDEVLVQVAYAIGVARPVSLYVNTYGTNKTKFTDSEIANKLLDIFDMRPKSIEDRLKLREPKYLETASYGHVGRTNRIVTKQFKLADGSIISREVELFTWEKLDYIDQLKNAFL